MERTSLVIVRSLDEVKVVLIVLLPIVIAFRCVAANLLVTIECIYLGLAA